MFELVGRIGTYLYARGPAFFQNIKGLLGWVRKMVRNSFPEMISVPFSYSTNEKLDPFRIDMTHLDDPEVGIFKIEGDRLTICYRIGRHKRPKNFGEKEAIEEVLKRVKKKE